MKFLKVLATTAIITCLTASVTFAAPESSNPPKDNAAQQSEPLKKEKKDFKGKNFKHGCHRDMQQDPVKALENRKIKIQEKLKEGKITKEKADAITSRIDAKIKEIKEFDKLSLQQKKEKLISSFKEHLDAKVKDGKITREKADELIKKHTERVEKWDGKGYPQFHKKGFKGNKGSGTGNE